MNVLKKRRGQETCPENMLKNSVGEISLEMCWNKIILSDH